MNEIRTCNNRCIFCFVRQLPPGLRQSLYVKDDDFLLSYMYGNFVTLSNLGQTDLTKIIDTRLEPLYVSLHSLGSDIRRTIFGTSNHQKGLKNFKILAKNLIDMHIQIVLCPHINDGQALVETLDKLVYQYPSVKSVGIVPVGLTRFNQNSRLKPVKPELALETIDIIDKFNQYHDSYNKIFLSDEFYIIGQKPFPPYHSYYDFCQINNGIGKSREFIEGFKKGIKDLKDSDTMVLTSEYGKYVFDQLQREISLNLSFHFRCIKNNFLGTGIKVTGLLCGVDIRPVLNSVDFKKYSQIIIPDCIFNQDGLTLDGYTRQEIMKINDKLIIIGEDAENLLGVLKKYG